MSGPRDKCAIYLRISRDATGEGSAFDRQEPICRRVAEERGWDVVAVYRDEASASKRSVVRPDYQRMRADWAGGDFEKVVVYDLDRLTRQGIELESWILAADEQRRRLVIASPNGDYDLLGDGGQLFARLKAAVAAAETSRKSQRQRDANRQRAERGKPPLGTRLFGYETDGITVREDEAKWVRQIFEGFVAGLPLRAISRDLDAAGVTTRRGGSWSPSTVRGILENRRYAGRTYYLGETLEARSAWRPLVDDATYDAAQAILRDPTRLKHAGTEKRRLGAGLYLCGVCERPMQQTGQVYWCRGHISRKMDAVDAFVDAVMAERLSRPDVVQALAGSSSDKEQARSLREQVRSVELRKQRFERDYYDGGQEGLTLTEFRRLMRRADDELAELQREESRLVATDVAALLGPNAVEAWTAATVHVRQAVIRSLCSVTLQHTGRRGPTQRAMFDPASVVFDWAEG